MSLLQSIKTTTTTESLTWTTSTTMATGSTTTRTQTGLGMMRCRSGWTIQYNTVSTKDSYVANMGCFFLRFLSIFSENHSVQFILICDFFLAYIHHKQGTSDFAIILRFQITLGSTKNAQFGIFRAFSNSAPSFFSVFFFSAQKHRLLFLNTAHWRAADQSQPGQKYFWFSTLLNSKTSAGK